MKKREPDALGRAVVSELVSIFKRMREDASAHIVQPGVDPQAIDPSIDELTPREFLRRVRESLADPATCALLLEALEAYVAGNWPRYVSCPEPDAETASSRKLFPKAHAGNVRRLIDFVYRSPCGACLGPSTRAYVMLSVLILMGLSPWSDRTYTAFTDYLSEELGVTDKFNIRFVLLFWRRLPLKAWAADKARKRAADKVWRDAPSNADDVMRFASMVRRCICTGGTEPDARLL